MITAVVMIIIGVYSKNTLKRFKRCIKCFIVLRVKKASGRKRNLKAVFGKKITNKTAADTAIILLSKAVDFNVLAAFDKTSHFAANAQINIPNGIHTRSDKKLDKILKITAFSGVKRAKNHTKRRTPA